MHKQMNCHSIVNGLQINGNSCGGLGQNLVHWCTKHSINWIVGVIYHKHWTSSLSWDSGRQEENVDDSRPRDSRSCSNSYMHGDHINLMGDTWGIRKELEISCRKNWRKTHSRGALMPSDKVKQLKADGKLISERSNEKVSSSSRRKWNYSLSKAASAQQTRSKLIQVTG